MNDRIGSSLQAALAARHAPAGRVALDIGSTVVKVARLGDDGTLLDQQFHPRDFDAGIARQVVQLLDRLGIDVEREPILSCSSANGGLRVGIVCLSAHFSGAAMRNQVLLAGANPVFVHEMDGAAGDPRRVDILLVGGGIDCEDAAPARARLGRFDPGGYRFGTLVYAGNRFLAADFARRFPHAVVIDNPLGETLSRRVGSVFDCVRRAYLDDLVHKEGVSELPPAIARGIRPTPEVASRGFLRAVSNQSTLAVVGACVVLDIGGATTDLHYTVEIVAEDSPELPAGGVSVARYVFTDLGIVASLDTLLQQLRLHPRLYEFLAALHGPGADVRSLYASLREGEHVAAGGLPAYACLFLALDRFRHGHGPGLPVGQLERVAQLVLTGGAAQMLDEAVVGRIVALLVAAGTPPPLVQIDRRYEIWVAGITWQEEVRA